MTLNPLQDPSVCRRAIRIKIDKKHDERISRTEILKSLIYVDSNLIDYFDTISTTGKNIWFISFKEIFDYKDLIGKSIKINEHDVQIEDGEEPIKVEKTFTFKFYGLKPNFDKYLIEKHLLSEGVDKSEIFNIYDEYLNDPVFKHVKTGVIRAKLKFNPTQNKKYYEIVKNLPKNTYIQGIPVSVERVGEPRCRFCFSPNHKIAECQSKNLLCTNCNRRVHTLTECNLAKRISNNNEDHIFDDVETVDNSLFDNNEPQISNNRPKKPQKNNKNQVNKLNISNNSQSYRRQSHRQRSTNHPLNSSAISQTENWQPFRVPLTQTQRTNSFDPSYMHLPSTPKPPEAFYFGPNNSNRNNKRGNEARGVDSKTTPENIDAPKPKKPTKNQNKKTSKVLELTDDQIEKEASNLLNINPSN